MQWNGVGEGGVGGGGWGGVGTGIDRRFSSSPGGRLTTKPLRKETERERKRGERD